MSIDDAVKGLQRHERARQGRLRALFMKQINLEERRRLENAKKGAPRFSIEEATVIIQATVRGFLQRRRTAKVRHDEHAFIGMTKIAKRNSKVFDEATGGILKRRQK